MPTQYQTKLFINNEYVDAHGEEIFAIHNPHDESLVLPDVHIANEQDVEDAVNAASAAFKGPWSSFSGQQRAACMLKLAELIQKHGKELMRLETVAMGIPQMVGAGLIDMAVEIWRYYAGYADKIPGESHAPEGDGLYKIVRQEPLGVCAGIIAWNGTPWQISMKLAPALAAGNTFILKPSEKAPLGSLAWGKLFVEAGFPPGVVNILTGAGSTGALLASHMKISKISFTGSTNAGRKVNEASIKSNLKRCTLELGGKSPTLVFDDADFENTLNHCSRYFLANSAQACVAGSRLLIQEGIAKTFIPALKDLFAQLSDAMGDPSDGQTFLGPVADKATFDRIMGFIASGKEHAQPIVGGNRRGNKGFYVEPTIFLDPPKDSPIYKEEIFGPVLCVCTFKTEEEALQLANDTPYGLSSQLYTKDITRVLRVASKLEAGNVGVNTFHLPNVFAPFGGVKSSGIGREAGLAGLLAYMESKTISINMNLGA